MTQAKSRSVIYLLMNGHTIYTLNVTCRQLAILKEQRLTNAKRSTQTYLTYA